MAFSDEEVGLAPPRPRAFSDEEVGLAPASPPLPFGGAPLTDPQLDPAVRLPATLWERAKVNLREGFDGTMAGEVVNYNASGQNAQHGADDVFRAIVEARNAGSDVGLESYQLTPEERRNRPTGSWASPYAGMPVAQLETEFNKLSKAAADKRMTYDAERAQDKLEADRVTPWHQEEGVFGKAVAGLTALGGQVAGGALSPENFVGGPGGNVVRRQMASMARDAAGKMAPGAAESVYSYATRRVAPGVVEGAGGAAATTPIVQSGKIERGEQEGFEAGQVLTSVLVGGAVGGGFRMSGILWDGFRASRRKTGQPDATPETTSADEILNQLQVDPEFAALARANGVDPFSNDPRNAVLQDRLTRRRIEEQFRPEPETAPPTAAEWGTANQPGPAQQELARRQEERAAVEAGTVDPAAANVQPRQPDQRTIAVDSEGGAFREDPGTQQGRVKAPILEQADRKALPAPGRHTLTDEEIARLRRAAEGSQPAPDGTTQPPILYGGEGRALRTSDDLEIDREAREAFTLANRQRQRAGDAVRDTQVAGRPEGANQQVIHLDEGHPVEIINRRMVPNANGNMVEVATVRRYDPRTGRRADDAVEYDVPVRQLKTGNYAVEPRMAQDFEARARVERGPAGRMDESQGLPHQTYRETAPDPNAQRQGPLPHNGPNRRNFPDGSPGGDRRMSQNGQGRTPFPEQPEGPSPGRRWSRYEEAMRDFEARQQRAKEQPEPPPKNTYEGQKSSNQARAKDRDGRFAVDEGGFVMSSAQGPIRFADQKQAAKWILNVGQKQSPDQIFEIAVHPSGKGFTARETGRSEPPPAGGKPGGDGSTTPQEPPPAKPDTSPPRQLNGPRAEAPRSPTAEQPTGATVSGESFKDKLDAEKDRLWREAMGRSKRGKRSNESAVDQAARENIMREEAADHIRDDIAEDRLQDNQVYDVARFYDRADGETPERAFARASALWSAEEERAAIQQWSDSDLAKHDWLKAESASDPEFGRAIDAMYSALDEHYTGGRNAATDDIPFSANDAPREAGAGPGRHHEDEAGRSGAAERSEPGVGGKAAQEDRGTAGNRPDLDDGPDGGKQTVIRGAERITDRELAERRGEQPLRGGDKPPPKGGLFDEDARNQSDMFDGGNGPKFYSNPFFDPAAWKGLARALTITPEYFRDLRATFQRMKESWSDDGGKKTNGLADLGRTYVYSTDGELRAIGKAYDSPTIKKIADMLHAPADMGRGGAVARTYHEAADQRTVSNLNKLGEILKPFIGDQDKLNQIRQLVQNSGGIRKGNPIHDAAAKLRVLLDDEFRYLKDAGVDVGQVKDYFPRIPDAEKVLKNPADFVEAAAKQYLKDGLAKNRTEAVKKAEEWLASIELGHVGARKGATDFVTLGGSPNSDFRKERVFGRSIETDKSNPLAKYYVTRPDDALTLHFQRTARRAEWARRFGDDLGEWKKLKQAIVDEGNVAALGQVVRSIAVSTGVHQTELSSTVRSGISWLRTWGAMSLLPRAAITALSETAMPAIRSGNLTRVLGDTVRVVGALSGAMKKEKELAADLGVITNAIGDSILGRRYYSPDPGNKLQQDHVNRFFRRTGLEQLTNAQRVVSIAAGQTFLRRLAKDVDGNGSRQASSTAFLRELGVSDAKGFASWLNGVNDGMPSLADIRLDEGFSGQYRTALQRFSKQTSLDPNASTRPKWASHPIGSLAFMLQSYAYAFQKQVLNRAGAGAMEALTGKGYGLADRATMLAPAMLLPMLAAIQWGLAEPRDAIFGDPSSKPKTPEQRFMQVLSRSGLTGIVDPVINMATGARYGRSAAETLAGPVLGKVADLGTDAIQLGVKNSDKTNTAERNFAKSFYDATLMPATAMLAGFMPPLFGAIAIQAGSSGMAREAFTESVAGKKRPERRGPPQPPRPKRP